MGRNNRISDTSKPRLPTIRFGSGRDVQLWRVVHEKVVARSGASVARPTLDFFRRGSLVMVEKRVPNSDWVQLALPGKALGGMLNIQVKHGECAFLLTGGTKLGFGTLVEPTDMWVRL